MKKKLLAMSALAFVLLAGPSLVRADETSSASQNTESVKPASANAEPGAAPSVPVPPLHGPLATPPAPPDGMMPPDQMRKPCSHAKAPLIAPEQMKNLHEKLAAATPDMEPLFSSFHDLTKEKMELLGTEKFSPKAFLKIDRKIAKVQARIREAKIKAFLKIAPTLSPIERQFLGSLLDGMPMPPHEDMQGPRPNGMPSQGLPMPPHEGGRAPASDTNAAGKEPLKPSEALPAPAPKAPVEDAKPQAQDQDD